VPSTYFIGKNLVDRLYFYPLEANQVISRRRRTPICQKLAEAEGEKSYEVNASYAEPANIVCYRLCGSDARLLIQL